jgi:hypothetical protein
MYTPGIGSISGAIHLFARRPFISTMIVALAIAAAVVTPPAVAPPPAPPAPAAPMVVKSDGSTINYSPWHPQKSSPSHPRQKLEEQKAE